MSFLKTLPYSKIDESAIKIVSGGQTGVDKAALLLSDNVDCICQPLFKRYGINGFSYSRVFTDGSRSELWSNADALYHTFLRKKYIADTYTPYAPNNPT